MENVLERLHEAGVVPVVVIDRVEDAVPTAKALLAGGIDVMEITFRTAAAPDAIRAVVEQCPDMVVGAGTVTDLEHCCQAVDCGARFIVSPGFDERVVRWCLEHKIAVIPGCATPSEIMAAMDLGLDVVKFFPASVYGGLVGLKALSAPFSTMRFIPTGGIGEREVGEYLDAHFVHAVGGSWLCTRADISNGNFDKISALCRQARLVTLGFSVEHIGVNTQSEDDAREIAKHFQELFGFSVKEGNSSLFAGELVEIMKTMPRGIYGHIAIRTRSVPRAIRALEAKGISADLTSAKYRDGRMAAVYLDQNIAGFAIHLVQK